MIYDLLRAPDLRLTSTSNEIYATWLPASFCVFVFCFLLVTLEDFPQIKIFLMEGKSGSWELFSATRKLKAEELCGRECYGVINYSFIAKWTYFFKVCSLFT